jgi:hypothetical protein
MCPDVRDVEKLLLPDPQFNDSVKLNFLLYIYLINTKSIPNRM